VNRRFTKKQGQSLTYIHHYTQINGRPPAEADMQSFFGVTPPTVHQMILRLEGRGLIERTPGQARSIRPLVHRDELPRLRRDELPRLRRDELPRLRRDELPRLKRHELPRLKRDELPRLKRDELPRLKRDELPRLE